MRFHPASLLVGAGLMAGTLALSSAGPQEEARTAYETGSLLVRKTWDSETTSMRTYFSWATDGGRRKFNSQEFREAMELLSAPVSDEDVGGPRGRERVLPTLVVLDALGRQGWVLGGVTERAAPSDSELLPSYTYLFQRPVK